MAKPATDRQHLRHDFRELARLARPGGAPGARGFGSADSSGYVDLSAFSGDDAGWVDRELARAKGGVTGREAGSPMDAPHSVVPVALDALVASDVTSSARGLRGRRALPVGLGVAGVAVVGWLAVTLAVHPPSTRDAAKATAAMPSPVTPDPAPQSPGTITDPASTADVAAIATPSSPDPTASVPATTAKSAASPKRKTALSARTHRTPLASSPSPAHAAVTPAAVLPRSRAAAGNDSLMDLMKKSVATGK